MENELRIVGYLDDGSEYNDYRENLEEYVNLVLVENCNTIEDILSWILDNRPECLVVDHKLTTKYNFLGTDAVSFINKHIPDLPCIIITNYKNDSMQENLVMEMLIKERDDLPGNDGDFAEFGNQLKQACEVFSKRLNKREEEYKYLYNKKQNEKLSAEEEENLLYTYKILKNYGELDDIPLSFFTSNISEQMDALLNKLDKHFSTED